MELTSTFVLCVFFFLNTLFMLYLMNLPEIDMQPSFITSTEKEINFDSRGDMDGSLKKSISNYFKPTEVSKDKYSKIHPEITTTKNGLNLTPDNKVSMFLEQTRQEEIYVIKLNNDQDAVASGKEPKFGIISLYSVDARALTDKNNSEDDSLLKRCWSTKIFGRVIGVVTSENKQSVAIYYRIAKSRNSIDYRIRFIHNVKCDLLDEIDSSDYESQQIIDKFALLKKDLDSNYGNEQKDEMEITSFQSFLNLSEEKIPSEHVDDIEVNSVNEAKKNNKIVNLKSNYLNNLSYDDFILPGNKPISYITIQKNILAYCRDNDDFEFRIYKRVETEVNSVGERIMWTASAVGPPVDKTKFAFFHTNSIKLVPDINNDYRIVHINIAISQTLGVILSGKITVTNHVQQPSEIYTSLYESTQFFTHRVDNDLLDSDFNIEKSIQNLRQYMKPTIYSNTNKENLFFEIYNSTILISMDWNQEDVQFQYLFELKSKISRLYSDPSGENLLAKFEDSDDLVLIKRKKISKPNENENFYGKATPYSISLKKIPEKLRDKKFVSFSLENIDDKIVLFALNEDGVFFALDLSEKESVKQKNAYVFNWIRSLIYPRESLSLKEVLVTYFLTNIIPVLIYLKYNSSNLSDTDEKEESVDNNKEVQKIINKMNKLESKIKKETYNLNKHDILKERLRF